MFITEIIAAREAYEAAQRDYWHMLHYRTAYSAEEQWMIERVYQEAQQGYQKKLAAWRKEHREVAAE